MKQSKLFTKTSKSAPADADSTNARLLTQAGFINQLAAGVYTYLPLGFRVLEKIKDIVREEMDAIGGQEVLMPALQPKQLYDATQRWDKIDVLFKVKGAGDKEYGLGSTAEEVITPLVKEYVKSYKDLPVAVYQIQDKFRNEPRAKSGLLRGREFSMKDLYSFHSDEQDFLDYYEKVKEAYLKIYKRCGLDAIVAAASGGVFTDKNSHEFQVATEAGEDSIYIDKKSGEVLNKEIVPKKDLKNTDKYDIVKSIEVGNIFPLECRFTNAFDFKVTGEDGKPLDVIMGCYGIGPSRVMGSIVEVHNDERGMIWPKAVAPFAVHLISLSAKSDDVQSRIDNVSEDLYTDFIDAGVEVLWDDRTDMSAGEKFGDADLIGLPLRLVISEKTLKEDSVEWKERASKKETLIKLDKITEAVHAWLNE
ncbi:MAG: aminoacyl--tRNA ligase-related protein [bacterium]